MSDWRIPLATDLARRAHKAGARSGDREVLKKVIYELADQEKDFLRRNPDQVHKAVGYSRAIEQYGKNGLGQLISMAFKYWPVEQVGDTGTDVVSRLSDATEFQPALDWNRDMGEVLKKTQIIPEPPKPVVVPLSLEPIEIAIQVLPDAIYDEQSVLAEVQRVLSGIAELSAAYRESQVIDMRAELLQSVSILQEKVLEIPWITDVITKPISMFRTTI